jgi:hypothetical protein
MTALYLSSSLMAVIFWVWTTIGRLSGNCQGGGALKFTYYCWLLHFCTAITIADMAGGVHLGQSFQVQCSVWQSLFAQLLRLQHISRIKVSPPTSYSCCVPYSIHCQLLLRSLTVQCSVWQSSARDNPYLSVSLCALTVLCCMPTTSSTTAHLQD